MARRGKTFELLDFPKFATPSVMHIDAAQTAGNLIERLGGVSFMSYGQIWPRMSAIVNGFATETFISQEFNAYSDDWKNSSIQDAATLLAEHFGGRGKWYPFSTKPVYVLGFWFKPSIKGIWFVDGRAHAVLVNARKGQRLPDEVIRFLARGVYELHCVDDPNDPVPLIVDLSEQRKGEGRSLRVHITPAERAITLDEFDAAVREFVKALALAGVALPSETDSESMVNLFKKK
jgi:hypothetical protein